MQSKPKARKTAAVLTNTALTGEGFSETKNIDEDDNFCCMELRRCFLYLRTVLVSWSPGGGKVRHRTTCRDE